MRIIVTGAAGRLGRAMWSELSSSGHVVEGLTRAQLDVTDAGWVRSTVAQLRPQVIVNCSAFNAIEEAEGNPETAYWINSTAPRLLARAARSCGAVLVHFSADFVFDGNADVPYTEESETNPLSVFGSSKLGGEEGVRQTPRHYVLRLASPFGGIGRGGDGSTVDAIADTLLTGGVVRATVDCRVSPSYVPDVVRGTRKLIESGAPYGLYHCVNSGVTTWYDLARAAARTLGVSGQIHPVRASEMRTRAPRPRFCALSNERLIAVGVDMPHWQFALRRHLTARLSSARPSGQTGVAVQ